MLNAQDIDGDILTYSYTMVNEDLVDNIIFNDNNMTVTSKQDSYGSSDINVSVTDGNITVSKVFNFYIVPLEDGEDIERVGDIVVDENNDSSTITLTISNDLVVVAREGSNGRISHVVRLRDHNTSAFSALVGAMVELIENGVQTSFTDIVDGIVAKVVATILGEAVHTLEVAGKTTTARFEKAGAFTVIEKDADGKTRVVTTQDNVKVIAHADGSAEHTIGETKVTVKTKGTATVMALNGDVTVEANDDSLPSMKAVVITKPNGELVTKFMGGEEEIKNIFEMPYVSGSQVIISLIDGVLYIQTKITLDENLVVQ